MVTLPEFVLPTSDLIATVPECILAAVLKDVTPPWSFPSPANPSKLPASSLLLSA